MWPGSAVALSTFLQLAFLVAILLRCPATCRATHLLGREWSEHLLCAANAGLKAERCGGYRDGRWATRWWPPVTCLAVAFGHFCRVLQQRRGRFTSRAGKGIDWCLQREATRRQQRLQCTPASALHINPNRAFTENGGTLLCLCVATRCRLQPIPLPAV